MKLDRIEHVQEPEKIRGKDGRWKPTRHLTADEKEARDTLIAQRRADGMAIQAIANELGCSVGTVHGVIKRMRSNA